MTPRLKLAMEHDGPSRGRHVRDVVQQLLKLRAVRGALLVGSDGFVVVAEVPDTIAVEPLAAMAARLGRELEASAARMGRTSFSTAVFSGPDGPMFLAAAPIGYVVVLAEQRANLEAIRSATEEAVALIQAAWAPPDGTAS
ncbi:MAG TPA: roadblock/LC7 domain-containing protein [Methylomirabilota bacterium]|jgi:predicted regulator of Ras-like GTPase activity (Roadblock/LC7/MglB family)